MPDKEYTVIIFDKAMSMLEEHIRFLAQVSTAAAKRLRTEIIDEMRKLNRMPQSYPCFKAKYIPVDKYRKMLVGKQYLIIYQIVGKVVCIDYVLDCRQDYRWLI